MSRRSCVRCTMRGLSQRDCGQREHQRLDRQRLTRFTQQRHMHPGHVQRTAARAARLRASGRGAASTTMPAAAIASNTDLHQPDRANDHRRRGVDVGVADRNVGRPQMNVPLVTRRITQPGTVLANVLEGGAQIFLVGDDAGARRVPSDRSASPRFVGCRATRARSRACRRARILAARRPRGPCASSSLVDRLARRCASVRCGRGPAIGPATILPTVRGRRRRPARA